MPCHSVPSSPAMARSAPSTSGKQGHGQPVTPQRMTSQRQQHRYSSSQSFHRSPITPASPYTPLSLRSFSSSASGGSSTLTTPDHSGVGMSASVRRLFASPEVVRSAAGSAGKDRHTLADIAENWRARAGVKVSSGFDGSHFGDDEVSETSEPEVNDSLFISTEEALLAPFVAQKRQEPLRQRAHSHVPPPSSRVLTSPTISRNTARAYNQPSSPLVARRLNQSQNVSIMSTPPQNRHLARQLKMKGSLTDPPQPRRRERVESLRTPQNFNRSLNLGLNYDTSLDLFDIDENDFEYDVSYDRHVDEDTESNPSLMDLNFRADPNSTTSINTNAYGYTDYPPPLPPSYQQHQYLPSPFADPFHGHVHALSSIPESVEHYFHTQKFRDNNMYAPSPIQNHQLPPGAGFGPMRPFPQHGHAQAGYMGNPAWVPLPAFSSSLHTQAPFNFAVPNDHKHSAPPPQVQPRYSQPSTRTQTPTQPHPSPPAQVPVTKGCSVCLSPHPRTLAILAPCAHPLCSACLTSALNIVGEKDMECAVCKGKVADFRLVPGSAEGSRSPSAGADKKPSEGGEEKEKGESKAVSWEDRDGKSFLDPLFSSPGSGSGKSIELGSELEGLDSAFEFGLALDGVRASTPKNGGREGGDVKEPKAESVKVEREKERVQRRPVERERVSRRGEENVVLRIDNVPWDITPPQIEQWLQQPLERVHVLLDRKGKTMSHAYVEVGDVDVAGRILRGEVQVREGGEGRRRVKERGSVLGKGRRARGVTITRSAQEELMRDLFPNWRGTFDRSRPSLAGLESERVIGALESGLIGESEVVALLHLIKEPDSHFLKSPSLPFHSLISILSKFPTDVDSRVFWSAGVRDILYDVTYAAIQVLLSRVKAASGESEYTMELVVDFAQAGLDCQAFTARQLSDLTELAQANSVPLPVPSVAVSVSTSTSASSTDTTTTSDLVSTLSSAMDELKTPDSRAEAEIVRRPRRLEPAGVEELAKEFGVEAHLVQALAQRLASAGLH